MAYRKKKKGKVRRIMTVLLIIVLALVLLVLGLNILVVAGTKSNILSEEEACGLEDVDCILVLGCHVRADGSPSDMLNDRVQVGIRLYQGSASDRLLMSGDHGTESYNEVKTMKDLAVNSGIDADDVFCDHAGFSTYESMVRAKKVFGAKKILIVTQGYHLSRAVYIAKWFGMEAYGVASDEQTYVGQFKRDVREVAARCKDVIYCIFAPEPTYLGDPISLEGKGSQTDG